MTKTTPRIGKPGEPIAELTRLGWTIMSPGNEPDLTNMFLTQTSVTDYEELCRLDVLGLEDFPTGDQENVYADEKPGGLVRVRVALEREPPPPS